VFASHEDTELQMCIHWVCSSWLSVWWCMCPLNDDGIVVNCRRASESGTIGSVPSHCSLRQWKQTFVSIRHAVTVLRLSSASAAETHERYQQPGTCQITVSVSYLGSVLVVTLH